jgi:hypothetical protein
MDERAGSGPATMKENVFREKSGISALDLQSYKGHGL